MNKGKKDITYSSLFGYNFFFTCFSLTHSLADIDPVSLSLSPSLAWYITIGTFLAFPFRVCPKSRSKRKQLPVTTTYQHYNQVLSSRIVPTRRRIHPPHVLFQQSFPFIVPVILSWNLSHPRNSLSLSLTCTSILSCVLHIRNILSHRIFAQVRARGPGPSFSASASSSSRKKKWTTDHPLSRFPFSLPWRRTLCTKGVKGREWKRVYFAVLSVHPVSKAERGNGTLSNVGRKISTRKESRTRDTLSNFFTREIYFCQIRSPSFLSHPNPFNFTPFFCVLRKEEENWYWFHWLVTHLLLLHSSCKKKNIRPRTKERTFIPVILVLWSFQVTLFSPSSLSNCSLYRNLSPNSSSSSSSSEILNTALLTSLIILKVTQMAHSATCLPFTSLSSFYLFSSKKEGEESEGEAPSFIEGQIDDSTAVTVARVDSFDSIRLPQHTTNDTTDTNMFPSLPLTSSTVLDQSRIGLNLTNNNSQKEEKLVNMEKRITHGSNMSSCLNQVTIWSLTFMLLLSLISIPSSVHGLQLKPPTPEKEVFTGDSFVVTCLTESPSSTGLKLQWIAPDGREVATTPTAPIYVSEKPDGLQIVFLRHAKKHTGRYLCVQTNVSSFFSSLQFLFSLFSGGFLCLLFSSHFFSFLSGKIFGSLFVVSNSDFFARIKSLTYFHSPLLHAFSTLTFPVFPHFPSLSRLLFPVYFLSVFLPPAPPLSPIVFSLSLSIVSLSLESI